MRLPKNLSDSIPTIYRSSIVLIFSILTIFLTSAYHIHDRDLLQTGALIGGLQVLFTMTLGALFLKFTAKNTMFTLLHIYFGPNPSRSIAFLMHGTAVFCLLLQTLEPPVWNLYYVSDLLFSYLAGSAFANLAASAVGARQAHADIVYRIDADRYDAFAGSLIGSVLLGAYFMQSNPWVMESRILGTVYLPLVTTLITLGLTYLWAVWLQFEKQINDAWLMTSSLLIAFVLLLSVTVLVRVLLPDPLLIEGREYGLERLILAMQIGISAGVISGGAVRLYKYFSKQYIHSLLNGQFKQLWVNVSVKMLINGFVALLPLLITGSAILLTYQLVGLYGLALGFLCMVSNVGVSLLIGQNYLALENIHYLSKRQHRKLERLLPDISQVMQEKIGARYKR